MNSRVSTLAAVLAALVVAALGYWFVTHFERVPVEVPTGYRGEARRDDYLAARRLYESFSTPLRVVRDRRGLPASGGTLVMVGRRDARRDPAPLLRWVEGGGHLVVAAAGNQDDALFEELGVEVVSAERPDAAVAVAVDRTAPLQVRFRASLRLAPRDADGAEQAGDEKGLLYWAAPRGQGRVTVLADAAFLRNAFFGEQDHAAFLWRLTHWRGRGEAWLVLGDAARSLWSALLERGWAALTSIVALLVAAAWAVGRRFGPPIPQRPAYRRRLGEHIAASGEFCWRHGSGGALHAAVRDSLVRSVEFRHPGWLAGDLAARLAQASGLPRARVAAAFAPVNTAAAAEFTEAVAVLERIRRSL